MGRKIIPSYIPIVDEIEEPVGFAAVEYMSVKPPLIKIPDGRIVVNYWKSRNGKFITQVWGNCDHPNISLLPHDAPKEVIELYRKPQQLAYLRMSDAAPWMNLVDKARDAWDRKYNV